MRQILFLLLLFSFTNASKILFVVVSNSKSHLGSLFPLAQAFTNNGHDVTMYIEVYKELGALKSGVKSHYVIIPRYPEDEVYHEAFKDSIWNGESNPYIWIAHFNQGKTAFVKAIRQESFWSIANQTWDFIIGDEICTPTAWALGLIHKERNGTPYAVASTTDMLHTFTTKLSLHRNPINSPSYYLKLAEPLSWHVQNFLDRMFSLWYAMGDYIIVGMIAEWDNRKAIALLDYPDFTWSRFYLDASMVFFDYPERLIWPMPIGNDFVFTGSTCINSNALPEDLNEFVSDPESKGTIVIAFGSHIQWDVVPRRVVNALQEAVNNLTDYRVVWSYIGQDIVVKSHVKLMEWIPQNDLLSHPKTKLFVSHGGLKSVKEAICTETPVLYMPLFCEQVRSALMAIQLGYAEHLNKFTVDAEQVYSQMTKLLSNFDAYHKQVWKTKSLFTDRIANPLDEVVFWTEKCIRYGKRSLMFQRAGMKLNWVQFLNVDVTVTLFGFVIVFGTLLK